MSGRAAAPGARDSQRNTPVTLSDLVRGLDWREELLGVAIVLAEAALVYLLCGFLLADTSPSERVLPAWTVVMLLLTAHLVPHLMDEWRVWSPQYETTIAVAITATLLITIKVGSFPSIAVWDTEWLRQTLRSVAVLSNDAERTVWGVILLTAYAWWRGRTRAVPSIDSAYTMLRGGTVALAVIIVLTLAATTDTAQVRDRMSVATIAFFAATLTAIGFARLRLEGFRTSAPLGPRWLATFVAPILAVVVIAIVGAGIFSRQFLDTVIWMLSPVLWFLSIVFQVFVLILAIIAFAILTPIVWLIGTREPRALNQTGTPTTGEDGNLLNQTGGDPFQVPDPLRYLIAAIILFIIFSALTKFVFRRRRRERGATDEERESVLEIGDLFGSLGARLRGLLHREPKPDPLAHLRGDPRWRYTLEIRETYRRLQQRGQEAGRARYAAETADEYRPALINQLSSQPAAPGAVATITERYRDARYSGLPAAPEHADAARQAWQRLQSTVPSSPNRDTI